MTKLEEMAFYVHEHGRNEDEKELGIQLIKEYQHIAECILDCYKFCWQRVTAEKAA